MTELGSKFNLLMKYLQAEFRPLFPCFNVTFLKRQIKHLIMKLLIHLTAQMSCFCALQRGDNGGKNPSFLVWWSVWFWHRTGMRKVAHICSSCTMHQCLWDGSSSLGPDGCQDTGWAHYPDIIKGLKWKPFGDYSICFSTTCAPLISAHYCDGVMHSRGWTRCWRCPVVVYML